MSRAQAGGFTLVELLVAMAVTALVMAALLSVMRSLGTVEDRLDDVLRRDEELRVGARLLRQVMASIAAGCTAEPAPATAATPAPAPAFSGTPEHLQWVGVMPAREGAGGLYRFDLGVQAAGNRQALVLRFAPCSGAEADTARNAGQSRLMASPVKALRLRYGAAGPASAWSPAWPSQRTLPRRIGVTVVTDRESWPEIVVAVVPVEGARLPAVIQPDRATPSDDVEAPA